MGKDIAKKGHFTGEGIPSVNITKSHNDSSKSFVSPDFSDKSTWYYGAIEVVDEIATTSDNITYSFGTSKIIIDLDKITDRADYQQKGITVRKNDVVVTTGFTINPDLNTVVFSPALTGSDTVKVSYSYENGSLFELIASAGKKILLEYVETQFSAGSTFNDTLVFELILNNAATGNTDYVAAKIEYKTAKDFLNKGNHGTVLEPFGELTAKINIFPWNYLTGFVVKPIGEPCDPNKNEFNKITMYLANDNIYTDCEIASGTFYCLIEDL